MSKYTDKVKRHRNKAHKLWKEAVFHVYGHRCESCGKPASDPHHMFPRSSFGHLALSIENGVPLCRKCHFSLHTKSDPRVIINIKALRGDKWYVPLKEIANNNPKSFKSLSYYKEKIAELEKILDTPVSY